MAIEFRCVHCNKLLRTDDDTVGKQAKCPECGTVMTVPSAAASEPSLPPQSSNGDNPFGAAGPMPSYQGESGNPYQSPSPFATFNADLPQGPITPSTLDVGDVLTRTWNIFKLRWGMCVLVFFIVFMMTEAASVGLNIGDKIVAAAARDPFAVLLFMVPTRLALIAFVVWIHIGQAKYFLKVARGQMAEVTEIFSGGPQFLTILLANILVGLMVGIGFLLLIVPGIVLGCMFSQFYYLILDRRVGVFESLSQSCELTSGNKAALFVLALAALGILVAGVLACLIGYFVAMPFVCLMSAVIYLAITGQPTADKLQYRQMA